MRLSLRNQILIPLVAIQSLTVCAVTAATATLAAWRSEREIIDRLDGVVEALVETNFPYTDAVLARMRGLSGAEFVAYTPDDQVAASSIPDVANRLPPLRSFAPATKIDSLGQAPTVTVRGKPYFAVPIRPVTGTNRSALLILYPETSWRQSKKDATVPPLILGGASLLIMVPVTSVIAHRISRRIGAVNQRVARIADGDFSALDPSREQDEIADLVLSINAMCTQLRGMSHTIQQTERTRLLAQLAAGLAHQMRNSITGARMGIQLHQRRCVSPPDDQSLDVALRQLAITEEQVSGLLSLGRLEQQPARPCDIRKLLKDIALLVGPACHHANVTFVLRESQDPLIAPAEETSLRAATLNLVMNAIEAAGRGGVVRLQAIRDRDLATIEVCDSGPGPAPEVAASLFEPFATTKPEGVGLGLAIVQQVATRHGGTLSWIHEDSETRFRLSLPLVQPTVKESP